MSEEKKEQSTTSESGLDQIDVYKRQVLYTGIVVIQAEGPVV